MFSLVIIYLGGDLCEDLSDVGIIGLERGTRAARRFDVIEVDHWIKDSLTRRDLRGDYYSPQIDNCLTEPGPAP